MRIISSKQTSATSRDHIAKTPTTRQQTCIVANQATRTHGDKPRAESNRVESSRRRGAMLLLTRSLAHSRALRVVVGVVVAGRRQLVVSLVYSPPAAAHNSFGTRERGARRVRRRWRTCETRAHIALSTRTDDARRRRRRRRRCCERTTRGSTTRVSKRPDRCYTRVST